jgi:pimeloyl-ACP methyl ester carboxylesterase
MTDGGGGNFNFVQGKSDGDHVAGIIAYFKKKLPVSKVYLYGHSQGAFFAYWFGGEHPELVDGIVAHAGNVLGNVKHPKAAKEKVGIGILHGRADAVVPVECAYATEKVYKEQGYKKLKLMVVEGLNEQTGHWPLPKQVAEMLAWLDQVSADTARAAVAVALGELAREAPDFAVVAESAAAASRLLKSAKPDEKALLTEQAAALDKLLADVSARHAAALAQRPDAGKGEPAFGAFAAHFRAADRQLASLPAWQAAAKDLRQRAAAQQKAVAAASAKLDKPSGGSFAEALKAAESGFLAEGYDDLVAKLQRVAAAPPKGLKPEDAAKLQALVGARKEDSEKGAEAALVIAREEAARFREQHASWMQ